jgi:hypothetical protein
MKPETMMRIGAMIWIVVFIAGAVFAFVTVVCLIAGR